MVQNRGENKLKKCFTIGLLLQLHTSHLWHGSRVLGRGGEGRVVGVELRTFNRKLTTEQYLLDHIHCSPNLLYSYNLY